MCCTAYVFEVPLEGLALQLLSDGLSLAQISGLLVAEVRPAQVKESLKENIMVVRNLFWCGRGNWEWLPYNKTDLPSAKDIREWLTTFYMPGQ